MKKAYDLYPNSPAATNLSMLGGGARLLALILLAGAVLGTLALVLISSRPLNGGMSLLWLIDELDDELLFVLALWCGSAICGYISRALRSKAEMLGERAE
ncbi:MAG: hypothetical protein IJC43_01005 [Clostridia bacterium]|nr:hypothetical protein [Clostridia bacterium]